MGGEVFRVRRRLVSEHWHFTGHRLAIRTDGHVGCSECPRTWQLGCADVAQLAALAEYVDGDLVVVHVVEQAVEPAVAHAAAAE